MDKNKIPKPPRLAHWLLSLMSEYDESFSSLGDFEEYFNNKARDEGRRRAIQWYWSQVLRSFPSYFLLVIKWRFVMFGNYLKIAVRNIIKHKGVSFLNVMGLSIGIAACILIFLYVQFELSYDRYHANAEQVYRIGQEIAYLNARTAATSAPLAEAMITEFPEIQSAVRMRNIDECIVRLEDRGFLEKKIIWADPQIFDLFSFDFLRGDPKEALIDPFSIVISERTAEKYFGRADPIGKVLTCNIRARDLEMVITGVYKNMPPNSHFFADLMVPFETQEKIFEGILVWGNNAYNTYALLHQDADPQALEAKFATTDFTKYSGGYSLHDYFLQPILDIHLRSNLSLGMEANGDIKTVMLFSFIALLILIIACINAMNLATARAAFRVKEVGLRKVIGAQRSQIIRQFLGESLVFTILALFAALAIVLIALPAFGTFVERSIHFHPLSNLPLLGMLISLVLLTGVLSGGYPAFALSSFRPVSLFRKTGSVRTKGLSLRNLLVIFQFAVSIVLIICTLVARNQLHLLRHKDMGYNREHIVVLPILDARLDANIETLRTELKRNPRILHASSSSSLLNNVRTRLDADWPGRTEDQKLSFYTIDTDREFIDLYDMNIIMGRNFSPDFPSDQTGAFVINETGRKALGWENPIGKEFSLIGKRRGSIVGVVSDFHIQSMSQPIGLLALYLKPHTQNWHRRYLAIKILPGNIQGTLNDIQKTINRFAPGYPFEYSFFDDVFDQTFRTDQKMASLFRTFALIAILIACLGLFGLSSFSTEQRTKEIGIRKVLGASVPGIIILLGRELLKWVLLANLIAWPIGYFAMNKWLENFAYRTRLSVELFLLSSLLALIIAALTVGFQTLKSATANPIDSLRYE
ncbi:MAG: ABC transporter permease [Candidatus Aminicenantes bacterium]|nr:MAG: ABC transporter permease [Candidatus Aminicenantes bacterium]